MSNNSGLVYESSVEPSKIYVTINADGKFVKRLMPKDAEEIFQLEKEGTFIVDRTTQISHDGIRTRSLAGGPNAGKKIAEQLFNRIDNIQLIKCYIEPQYNSLVLVCKNLNDSNSPQVYITMGYFDGEFTKPFSASFIDRIPNIDINKPLSIVPYSFEDGGKKKRGITLYQDDKKVESAYTKDKGDKPMATEHKVGQKIVWDWSKVGEFQDKILKEFMEKLDGQKSFSGVVKVVTPQEEEVDLPF